MTRYTAMSRRDRGADRRDDERGIAPIEHELTIALERARELAERARRASEAARMEIERAREIAEDLRDALRPSAKSPYNH